MLAWNRVSLSSGGWIVPLGPRGWIIPLSSRGWVVPPLLGRRVALAWLCHHCKKISGNKRKRGK